MARPVKIVLTSRRRRVWSIPSMVSNIWAITREEKWLWRGPWEDELAATLQPESPRMMALATS